MEASSRSCVNVLFHCVLRVQIMDDTVGLNIARSDVERLLYAVKSVKIGARSKPDRLGLVSVQLQSARGTPFSDIRYITPHNYKAWT